MFARKRIRLDPALHRRAADRARELGYASLDEWVVHMLEQALEASGDAETVERRLRGLGYLE